MTGHGAPFRWLFCILGGWVLFRAAALTLFSGPAAMDATIPQRSPSTAVAAASPTALQGSVPAQQAPARTPAAPQRERSAASPSSAPTRIFPLVQKPNTSRTATPLIADSGAGLGAVTPIHDDPRTRRWSASAWLFVRGSGASGLASGGQLGGGQAGARVSRSIGDSGLALTGRLSSPLHDLGGAEGAIGVDWKPLLDVPVRLAIERRIKIGEDSRSAWAAYGSGGFWKEGLPAGLVADGYAQAGIVGARQKDLFADGAIRVMRPIAVTQDAKLDLGVGAWGAAQPGVSRLDIGPHIGVRLPMGDTNASLSLDGRIRVAGDALPGSGVTLTLAADF